MTAGGPQNSTTSLVYYIYQYGFQFYKIGYASAVGVISVSYTHLDVYKRQVLRIDWDSFSPRKMNGPDTDFEGRNHRKS